jgi:cold shock CspA family protein
MGRSQDTFNKKEVRNKKEKKRKEKEKKRIARKDNDKKGSLDDMIAYVDEDGNITSEAPDPNRKKEELKLEDIEIGIPSRDNIEKMDPIRKGTVTFFNDSKGYGFIKDMETKEGIFVHINNVIDEIKEGNLVSFEVEMGHKGPTAMKVRLFK